MNHTNRYAITFTYGPYDSLPERRTAIIYRKGTDFLWPRLLNNLAYDVDQFDRSEKCRPDVGRQKLPH
jgi:hypothetical protein